MQASLCGVRGSPIINTVCDVFADTPDSAPLHIKGIVTHGSFHDPAVPLSGLLINTPPSSARSAYR
eukprot:6193189-Pleurochrysis_carterae.AAC.3